jgi:DNA-binding NarL/FixJ family response regulator
MTTFRILVVDDHEIVRVGVRSILEAHESWEICGEATDGREAVEKAQRLKPDLVILDVGMPNLNGLDAARHILHSDSRQRLLILTDDDSDRTMGEALQAGVRGFIFKSDPVHDLISAVKALQQGTTFFTSRVSDMLLDGYLNKTERGRKKQIRVGKLTAREREIIQLLAEGKSTKEVALLLDLRFKTAETHRANIMSKLGLHSVAQLVLYAVRNNIVYVSNSTALPPPLPEINGRIRRNFNRESFSEQTPFPELPEGSTFCAVATPSDVPVC